MADLIERQQAIDALRAMQTYKMFAGDDLLLIDQAGAQTELMMLPPVQPEQRWIPVTEMLPENDDKVLITHSHGISMAWWNGRYWTGSMIKKYKTVMAWMSLPEAYQGGGEKE